jgi:glucose-1-phosphate adenylyltransferase
LDKNVRVAPGDTIGYDLDRDRQRGYTVTSTGIVVVEGVRSRVELSRLQV